jgi:hypothetical protein
MSNKDIETIVYPLSSAGLIAPRGSESSDIADRYCSSSDRPVVETGEDERRAYWCRAQLV